MAVNGGSLDECFSNVFALLELFDLKWRCFVTPKNAPRGVPVQADFVLQAYGKCLRDGIICTWRRKPLSMSNSPESLPLPSFTNDISKELWLFWYSADPPDNISTNTSQLELHDEHSGTASQGIPYEVRVLFFNALHAHLERVLSKTGVIRIGRWFTKPLRIPGRQMFTSHYIMAYNMQFFVHGEYTVCMTVNAQRQPTLLRLSKRHLDCTRRVQVLLSPWSIRAFLLPASECDDSAKAQVNADRQWEEWNEFMTLDNEPDESTEEDARKEDALPKMVFVEVDGIRMMYPSCLVCITLEDDAGTQQPGFNITVGNKTFPTMTPDELITPTGARRNPLIVSNVNGFVHLQGVLQNAHLGKSQIPVAQDAFREPFPVQADNDTRWNFVDPGRPDDCKCNTCSFKYPQGFQGATEMEPAIECLLAHPIPVVNPAFPDQHRTNPAYTAISRQSKRRSENSYHRRWSTSEATAAPSGPPPPGRRRARSPTSETSSGEEATSDDEPALRGPEDDTPIIPKKAKLPDWATGEGRKTTTATEIHCSADNAATHYGLTSPTTSSDDEHSHSLQCSPFTPIKAVSPCLDCPWPSAPPELLSENVFNHLFKPPNGSTPSGSRLQSQEDRAKEYDYYYNPTMRENPVYMPYHSRRHGEKRRSTYPPVICMQLSPEQPGSQETIPATTSPPPDLDDRKRPADEPGIELNRRKPCRTNVADEAMPRYRRLRKSRRFIEWSEVAKENVVNISSNVKEDIGQKVSNRCGRITPSRVEIDLSEYCEADIEDRECTRGIGEGASGMHGMTSDSYDAMEVDGSIDMLSPPPSHEYSHANNHWPRIGGPPSVGDIATMNQMNQIYPTPPSVQTEAQQFSPAAAIPIHTSIGHMSEAQGGQPLSAVDLMTQPSHVVIKQEIMDEPMETEDIPPPRVESPQLEEEPEDPICFPVPDDSKWLEMLAITDGEPITVRSRKAAIPAPGRFTSAEKMKSYKLSRRLRNKKSDYHPNTTPVVPVKHIIDSFIYNEYGQRVKLPAVGINSTMSPITAVEDPNNLSYKVDFNPAIRTPNIAMNAHTIMQQNQMNHMPGYGQNQMVPMNPRGNMMNRNMYGGHQPHMGNMGMVPQPMQHLGYGGPSSSMQQLNNFANGPINAMYNNMGNQMNMGNHMGPMPMSPMGQPMGMYPGQHQQHQQHHQMMPYGMDQQHMAQSPMTPTGGYMTGQYGQHMGNPMSHQHQMQHQMMMRPQNLQMHQMQGMHHQQMNMHPGYMGGPGNMNMGGAGTVATLTTPARDGTQMEGSSIVLAIILQDTILDLHYDTVFDACPICSCNSTIRTKELGLYITPADILRASPQQQKDDIQAWSGFYMNYQGNINTCGCGFSPVRHRYLSLQAGMFPEDSKEATVNDNSVAQVGIQYTDPSIPSTVPWYNPASLGDHNMLNQLRMMCLRQGGNSVGKIVNHIALSAEMADKASKGQNQGVGFSIGCNAEYIVSQIDSTELMLLGNSTIDMTLQSGTGSRSRSALSSQHEHKFFQYFHPWGLQVANEVREPKEAEWRGLLSELTPVIEKAMRVVRPTTGTANIVEGPLTWKSLNQKRQKATPAPAIEDGSHMSEPIPFVSVATEKDLIRVAPQAIRLWEQLSLGPVDQPKDVLYLTVIPDSNDIHERSIKYMDQLSQLYERMRLGRHIAWSTPEVPDGIVRAGGRNSGRFVRHHSQTFDFLEMFSPYIHNDHNRVFMSRLRLFSQQMEDALVTLLTSRENEPMFDRALYRETIAKDTVAKKQAFAIIAAAAEKPSAGTDGGNLSDNASGSSSVPQREGSPSTPSIPMDTGISDLMTFDRPVKQEPMEQKPIIHNAPAPPTLDIVQLDVPVDDYAALPHTIVIYVMNPFTWGTDNRSAVCARVSTMALLRTFNAVVSKLPAKNRPQLHLEILSMEQMGDKLGMMPDFMNDGKGYTDVYDRNDSERELSEGYLNADTLRATALSVYTAPRILTPECVKTIQARTMTKFGPGSDLQSIVADWALEANPIMYQVPSTAFHLAPPPMLRSDFSSSDAKVIRMPQDEQVLYLTYCLIGSDFLCATVTDALGKLNDSILINIKVPVRPNFTAKHRAKTQILDTMTRLWTWIQGVMAVGLCNWRLVIGRLGKMGHGECRAWTHLLSKSVLRKVSVETRKSCPPCTDVPGNTSYPSVLSACLVATEPEPYLRMFPGYFNFNPENVNPKHKRGLSTPEDVSCTHIMVFPVTTFIYANGGDQAIEDDANDDWSDMLGGGGLNIDGDDELTGIGAMIMGMDGVDGGPLPSATIRPGGMVSFFPDNGSSEPLVNQPLATGFYVSTAPAGDLPDWFWASCPSAKRRTPVHLKSSLYINVQCAGADTDQDDLMQNKPSTSTSDQLESAHPLDSQANAEVLRHVLETYNALSWLNVDVTTGDRNCCLPIHMQSLLKLYHTVARLVV